MVDRLLNAVVAGINFNDTLLKRNTGEVVNKNGCGKMTHTFVKWGKLDGPGKIVGSCGVRKDINRVFCC